MSIEDFDACTHPPGIKWTEELARFEIRQILKKDRWITA